MCNVKPLLALFSLKILKVTIGSRTMASGGELSCPMPTLHVVHKSVKLNLKVFFFFPSNFCELVTAVFSSLDICMLSGFYTF